MCLASLPTGRRASYPGTFSSSAVHLQRQVAESRRTVAYRRSRLGTLAAGGYMTSTIGPSRPAHYDDQSLNYQDYWTSRNYEHDAEVMAVRRLLRSRTFEHAVDVGGGYGRLSVVLADFAGRVTLVDPSRQQLGLAGTFLAGHPRISTRLMDASALDLADESADLVSLIRVLHHLPDPAAELR